MESIQVKLNIHIIFCFCVSFSLMLAMDPPLEHKIPDEALFSRRISLLYSLMAQKWNIEADYLVFKDYKDETIINKMAFNCMGAEIEFYLHNPEYNFKPYFDPWELLSSLEKKESIEKLKKLPEEELFKIQLDEFKDFFGGVKLTNEQDYARKLRRINTLEAIKQNNITAFVKAHENNLDNDSLVPVHILIERLVKHLETDFKT